MSIWWMDGHKLTSGSTVWEAVIRQEAPLQRAARLSAQVGEMFQCHLFFSFLVLMLLPDLLCIPQVLPHINWYLLKKKGLCNFNQFLSKYFYWSHYFPFNYILISSWIAGITDDWDITAKEGLEVKSAKKWVLSENLIFAKCTAILLSVSSSLMSSGVDNRPVDVQSDVLGHTYIHTYIHLWTVVRVEMILVHLLPQWLRF